MPPRTERPGLELVSSKLLTVIIAILHVSIHAGSWNLLNLFYRYMFSPPKRPYHACRISFSIRERSKLTWPRRIPTPKVSKAFTQRALLLMKVWEQPVVKYLPVISAAQSGDSKRLQAETRWCQAGEACPVETHSRKLPVTALKWYPAIRADFRKWLGGFSMFSGGGWVHILVYLFFRKKNTALKADNACLTYWTSHLVLNPRGWKERFSTLFHMFFWSRFDFYPSNKT